MNIIKSIALSGALALASCYSRDNIHQYDVNFFLNDVRCVRTIEEKVRTTYIAEFKWDQESISTKIVDAKCLYQPQYKSYFECAGGMCW